VLSTVTVVTMSTTGENNNGAGVGSPPKKAVAESSGGGSSIISAPPAHADATVAEDTPTVKIDPITALQDDIGMYAMSCYVDSSRVEVDQRNIRIRIRYGSHLIWNYILARICC
jgi:hypothetical protein